MKNYLTLTIVLIILLTYVDASLSTMKARLGMKTEENEKFSKYNMESLKSSNQSTNSKKSAETINQYFYSLIYGDSKVRKERIHPQLELYKLSNDTLTSPISNDERKDYRVKILTSPLINDSPKDSFEYSKCDYARGFLYQIHIRNDSTADAMPVYAKLTQSSFGIFTSKHYNHFISLLSTLRLNGLYVFDIGGDKSSQGLNCFEITFKKKLKGVSSEILCTKVEKERNSWMEVISEMKKCSVKIHYKDISNKYFSQKDNENIHNTSPNHVANARGSSLSRRLKPTKNEKKITSKKQASTVLSKYKSHIPNEDISKNCFDKINIKGKTILEKLTTMTMRRKLTMDKQIVAKENLLKKAEKVTKEAKKVIRGITRRNKRKEFKHSLVEIRRNMTNTQVKLLKRLRSEINHLERREYSVKVRKLNKKIKEQKYKANKESNCYLRKHKHGTILRRKEDYSACIDTKLHGFKDKKFVENQCTRMFGEDGAYICGGEENYCNMCCGHYLGRINIDDRESCFRQCERVINS